MTAKARASTRVSPADRPIQGLKPGGRNEVERLALRDRAPVRTAARRCY